MFAIVLEYFLLIVELKRIMFNEMMIYWDNWIDEFIYNCLTDHEVEKSSAEIKLQNVINDIFL